MQGWIRLILFWAIATSSNALLAQLPILNHANGDVTPTSQANSTGAEANLPTSMPTKREEVAEKLRVAQRTLETAKEASEQGNTKPPERLKREVELLKQLEGTVAQLEVNKTEFNDLQTRLSDLVSQLEAVRANGPPEERPYSFLMLDHLRDDLAFRQTRTEAVDVATTSAVEGVTRAKEALEAKQQSYRRAKETEQTNSAQEDKKAELANATKLAEIDVRIATEMLAVRKQERDNQQLANELHKRHIELLEEKVKWIARSVVFSEQDLRDQMIEIDKQEEDLKSELLLAESNLEYSKSEWSRVRQQLDTSMEKNAELAEQVEAKQLRRNFYQTQVSLLNTRLSRRRANREIWQRRYQVIREEADTEELIKWSADAHKQLDQLEREKRVEQMRIDELRQDLVRLDKESQTTGDDAGQVRHWIQEQRETLSQLIQTHDANIVSIEASRRLSEKLVAEIEGDVMSWSFGDWVDGLWYYTNEARNIELMTVDDHPLTLGKVIFGVLLVFFGFVVARMLSRTLGHRLQSGRVRMNESGAAAIQSLSFYVFLVCFTLIALRFVNVPLTMFTFLGGAIAIGVGFGSQNVLNNFISGLILLAERPIKVGDLIQIDQLFGNIEHIGARSTIVRTGNNLDIIVPNSTFLENNVVNLTRGDDKLRTHVSVGIAYGSATREAAKLMKQAAVEHGRILNSPEPFVWFTDFGDNSLNFEVHFWVKVRSIADRTRIESDVRYRIDQFFRDAGITIAFPQRDIHFNASRPIPIQLLQGDQSFDARNAGAA